MKDNCEEEISKFRICIVARINCFILFNYKLFSSGWKPMFERRRRCFRLKEFSMEMIFSGIFLRGGKTWRETSGRKQFVSRRKRISRGARITTLFGRRSSRVHGRRFSWNESSPATAGFETLFAARIWQCIASIFADSLAEMDRSWPPTVEKQIYRVIVSILRDENLRNKV